MKLSILIVNWNSRDYLRKCLISIRHTCGTISPQVVVVDGGSFDGSAEMIACEFPEVEFVQSQVNIGFGRSNNLGFKRVIGDTLLLLNPDTELHPGTVSILLETLQQAPDAGMVGARLLNSDGSLQLSSVHPLPTAWNVPLDSELMRRRWWRLRRAALDDGAVEVEAVSGACMMLLSETFRQLGGFDPRYFMYAEDMDLCFKIRRSGLKIYHDSRASIIHHGGGCSSCQFNKFAVVVMREALSVYIRSNQGHLSARIYGLLMVLSAAIRLFLLAAYRPFAPAGKRAAIQASIWKWWTILRWSLGFETWSKEFFRFKGIDKLTGIPIDDMAQPTDG